MGRSKGGRPGTGPPSPAWSFCRAFHHLLTGHFLSLLSRLSLTPSTFSIQHAPSPSREGIRPKRKSPCGSSSLLKVQSTDTWEPVGTSQLRGRSDACLLIDMHASLEVHSGFSTPAMAVTAQIRSFSLPSSSQSIVRERHLKCPVNPILSKPSWSRLLRSKEQKLHLLRLLPILHHSLKALPLKLLSPVHRPLNQPPPEPIFLSVGLMMSQHRRLGWRQSVA